jgi:undecaprenyl diphosphate synthase
VGESKADRESRLLEEIRVHGNLPAHVAVIMDGNGRWARRRGFPRVEGHRRGVERVRDAVRAAGDLGLKVLTLYTFSTENWLRPADEISTLMRFLGDTLRREADELDRNNVRLSAMGRLEQLPPAVREELERTIARLSGNTGLILNLALSYSGRAELVDAARSFAADVVRSGLDPSALDEARFSRYLYAADLPDPDLLIRTSGEMRLSNFMLWQLAYSEIWVTDVLWPDFGRLKFLEAIRDYQSRDRRFGRVTSER